MPQYISIDSVALSFFSFLKRKLPLYFRDILASSSLEAAEAPAEKEQGGKDNSLYGSLG
jgi:hypothetical protein